MWKERYEIENNSFITFNDEVNNSVLLKMSLPYAQVIQFSSNTIFVEIKQNVTKKNIYSHHVCFGKIALAVALAILFVKKKSKQLSVVSFNF